MEPTKNEAHDKINLVEKNKLQRRRRVLGGSVGISVLAAMKSGSALAQGVCVAPSAFSSIRANSATSNRPTTFSECHSHGYWKNHDWPISKTTTVEGAAFWPNDFISGDFTVTKTTTLLSLIEAGGGGGKRAFAADLVSAYLDAKVLANSGQAPFTPSDIQLMWSKVFGVGSYMPSGSSTPWTETDIRNFLNVLIGDARL